MPRYSLLRPAAVCLAALLATAALPALAGGLSVSVEGLRSDKGNVIVALHRDGDPFPDQESPFLGGFRRAEGEAVSMTFGGLPPGRYAVVVLHDENLNRRVDLDFLGLPIEGFGFSNNALSPLGVPSFDAASFIVPDEGQIDLQIRLTYLVQRPETN